MSFREVYDTNKILGTILLILFFSLAGIPPFAGFYIKYNVLATAYFCGGVYNNIYIFFALISSTILLLVYLQMIISILRVENSASIKETSQAKVKNEKHNLPKLIYIILVVNTGIITLFD